MLTGLYAKLIAAAIIVAAVLGAVWYVTSLQNEVKELTTQNTLLSSKLKDQNDAIDLLKQDADARVKAGEEAVKAAKEETKKAKGRATVIYKTAPSTPGNDCKSALDLINAGATLPATPSSAPASDALKLLNGETK